MSGTSDGTTEQQQHHSTQGPTGLQQNKQRWIPIMFDYHLR